MPTTASRGNRTNEPLTKSKLQTLVENQELQGIELQYSGIKWNVFYIPPSIGIDIIQSVHYGRMRRAILTALPCLYFGSGSYQVKQKYREKRKHWHKAFWLQ